jgi:uncharacterized protein (DUF1697 family)
MRGRKQRGQRWVVFLRGVNVGGHRRFQPSLLARRLVHLRVINIGAAGTFVVLQPTTAAALHAAIRSCLPFDTAIMACQAAELSKLVASEPFKGVRSAAGAVHFVSVLARRPARSRPVPRQLPESGAWLVRVLGTRGRFVIGLHRRQMKAIGALGRLDQLLGTAVTTRSWSTIEKIAAVLDAN